MHGWTIHQLRHSLLTHEAEDARRRYHIHLVIEPARMATKRRYLDIKIHRCFLETFDDVMHLSCDYALLGLGGSPHSARAAVICCTASARLELHPPRGARPHVRTDRAEGPSGSPIGR